jgi:hypothetical protein
VVGEPEDGIGLRDQPADIRGDRLPERRRAEAEAAVGNHDIRHTRLSDGDSLAMLAVSDVLDVVPESGPDSPPRRRGRGG